MEKKDEELIRTLLTSEPELRERYEEHQSLEAQLDRLQSRSFLSPEEEFEKKRLQKLKLAGMDRIMEILARHRG